MEEFDPSRELPRDPTGSYLHLKLKRFPSIQELSMNYAKTTWKKFPYDAQVDIAPTSRSSCRQCHQPIEKGEIRMRLMLQCHKGCKNSAYFHFGNDDCFWKYPETSKLKQIDEINGLQDLSKSNQNLVSTKFNEFRNLQNKDERGDNEIVIIPTKKSKEVSTKSKEKQQPPSKRQKTTK